MSFGFLNEPWAKQQSPSIHFQKLQEECFSKLLFPTLTRSLLREFLSPDVSAERISELIKKNPYYESLFLKKIASRLHGEVPSLAASIALFGMQNCRKEILSHQLQRTIYEVNFTDERVKSEGDALVRVALQAEDKALSQKNGFGDYAFMAGFCWDWIRELAKFLKKEESIKKFIEDRYQKGLRKAVLSSRLGENQKYFSFPKYAFSGGLLSELGKAVFSLLEPRYVKFVNSLERENIPPELQVHLEAHEFNCSHDIFLSVFLEGAKVFDPIKRALLFMAQPNLVQSEKRNASFAGLMFLTDSILSNLKKAEDEDDEILDDWIRPSVAFLNIPKRQLLSSVNGLIEEGLI